MPYTHPKDRVPKAWAEFVLAVEEGIPETQCVKCGKETWNAWRRGYCVEHDEFVALPDFTADGEEVEVAEWPELIE